MTIWWPFLQSCVKSLVVRALLARLQGYHSYSRHCNRDHTVLDTHTGENSNKCNQCDFGNILDQVTIATTQYIGHFIMEPTALVGEEEIAASNVIFLHHIFPVK